jgi:mxaJ protein
MKVGLAAILVAGLSGGPAAPLRVCADPNNLPFSNQRLEGFENQLARLVAGDLRTTVAYTWWTQRRGYVRNTIGAGACDVLMGVPAGFDRTLTTRPYYRSAYTFVSRRDRELDLRTLDDPRLRTVRVGVQLVGDDGQNTPPAHALANRGVTGNLVGYTLYGDYLEPNPPARIVDAVARGDVDVAVVWGPLAGYFAARQSPPLVVRPVSPQVDRTGVPLAFDISVGVSRAKPRLRDQIDAVLARRHAEIVRLLDRYEVPRLPLAAAGAPADAR